MPVVLNGLSSIAKNFERNQSSPHHNLLIPQQNSGGTVNGVNKPNSTGTSSSSSNISSHHARLHNYNTLSSYQRIKQVQPHTQTVAFSYLSSSVPSLKQSHSAQSHSEHNNSPSTGNKTSRNEYSLRNLNNKESNNHLIRSTNQLKEVEHEIKSSTLLAISSKNQKYNLKPSTSLSTQAISVPNESNTSLSSSAKVIAAHYSKPISKSVLLRITNGSGRTILNSSSNNQLISSPNSKRLIHDVHSEQSESNEPTHHGNSQDEIKKNLNLTTTSLLTTTKPTLSSSSASSTSSSSSNTPSSCSGSSSPYKLKSSSSTSSNFSNGDSNSNGNSIHLIDTNAHVGQIATSSSTSSGLNSSSSSPSCASPTIITNRLQMPFKIRPSKYRHVYGNPHKEDYCYKNVKITKNAHDSAFCAVNPKFVAIVTEECGGGAFIVIPIKHTGRIDINMPKVCGHRGPVLDLKWNPFNDNEIASCSEDTTIKVWQIGDHGLYENLNEWIVDLHGHQRKVGQIEWHPTAESIMISSGADFQVILWNLGTAEPIRIITCHNETIQSMNWNRDGSLFATTCKDKKLRLIDPRTGTVVAEGAGHQGSKISKVVILGCGTKLFTTGFSKLSERQIALWNIKDLSKPIQMEVVDCSSGILIPYYDHDTKIVFVAGKGDGNIRYYEITDSEPYIHYLSEYKSAAPQRGLGFMPKRGLDVTKNEIFRFYKLHATGGICEPISMIVPRKSEVFQEDIYPDTLSGIPSLSCGEWISGETREPILISMKDGAVPFMPKIVTYKQLGYSELGNNFTRAVYNNGSVGLNRSEKLKGMNGNTAINGNGNHAFLNTTNGNYFAKNSDGNNSTNGISTSSTPNGHESMHSRNSPFTPWANSIHSGSGSHSNGDSPITRGSLPIAEVQPSARVFANKNIYNKANNSSPPLSPNLNNKHPRLNSEPSDHSSGSHSSGNYHNGDDHTADSLHVGGRASSNESMSQSDDSHVFRSGGRINIQRGSRQNEDLEASYLTSVSKNPILLRKTESLKLDSVQSIRNRFNRISSNASTLTRNTTLVNKNLDSANDSTQNYSNNNSNENLNTSHKPASYAAVLSANTNIENEPPPPPTLIISPMLRSQNGDGVSPLTPTPLITSAGSIASSTSSVSGPNGHGGISNYSEYFGLNSMNGNMINTNGVCVKKRVWTPVQSSPNTKQSQNANAQSNGSHQQFAELQRSYYRLLEEKNSLKEQLKEHDKISKQKDDEIQSLQKRIRQLENKLNSFSIDTRRIDTDTDC